MFIDSHCHLGFKELGGHTKLSEDYLKEAKNNGISIILDIATGISSFEEYINFAKDNQDVYAAIGIHPLQVMENLHFTKEHIKNHFHNKKLIALGETGLDYYYSTETKAIQKKFFEMHAEICSENNFPIIIHTRNAEKDTFDMLSDFVKNLGITGVIHCFSGNKDFARKLVDIGLYISFSGVVTFKNSLELQEAAKFIPYNRILTETDAPYLAPVPYRGKMNQPAYVRYTSEFLAGIRKENISTFASNVKNNFFELFKKANSNLKV